jgi:TRAP-type transport system periplasmic protein
MRTSRSVLIAVTVSLLVLTGLSPTNAPPASAAQFQIRLGHADPPDVYTSRKAASSSVFKQMVETESGGAIEVNLFPAGQLGGEAALAEATKQGTVQVAMLSGPFSNFCKEVQVLDIPYLFSSYNVAWKVLDGPFGKDLAQECLKKAGMRILTYGQVGFRNFTNSLRPIKAVADLKGMKVRVMESPVYMSLIRALGGAPVPVPWTETYTALQQKVVDAQENPVSSIRFAKLYEVQKYLTLDGHTYGVSFMLMNEKFFQGLPKEYQTIVKNAAMTASVVENGVDTLDSSLGVQFLREKGMEVYVPTPAQKAALKAAAQPAIIEYLEKQVGRPWIDKVLNAVKETESGLDK